MDPLQSRLDITKDWEYRRDAMDFAIRCGPPGLPAEKIVERATAFLAFLKGAAPAALLLLLTGCATAPPNLGQRIYADLACVTEIAATIGTVSADPAVQKASASGATALDVTNAIATIGTSGAPASVLSACAQTIQYGVDDAQALNAAAKAKVQEWKAKK